MAITGTKPWYKSSGILGSIMAFLAIVAGAIYNIDISPEEQEGFVTAILAVVSAVGAIIGGIGRIKATKRIE